jgi:hypothetical protein
MRMVIGQTTSITDADLWIANIAKVVVRMGETFLVKSRPPPQGPSLTERSVSLDAYFIAAKVDLVAADYL